RSPASVAPAGEAPPAIAAARTATPSRTLRFVIRPPPFVPAPVYHIFLAGAPPSSPAPLEQRPEDRRDCTFLSITDGRLDLHIEAAAGQRRRLSNEWNTAGIV